MDINPHPALVTGAGSGLGAATARRLAANGAKVALLDMNLDGAASVAGEIGGVAIECDVTDESSIETAVATARDAHGAARICVNCAGIGSSARIVGRGGPLPVAAFRREIEVNLIGTFVMLRTAAADMIALPPVNETGERGVIVNTASVAAFEGQIGQAAYSASKGRVVSLTLPAAREFAKFGICVLTIAPGLMDTPMLHGLPEEAKVSLTAQVPFPQRLGTPDEYAALVQHIVENAMLNAEIIRLDGAIRMAPR